MIESTTTISTEESSGIKLDSIEERILKDQISVAEKKESYITLYRFATKLDWIILLIGLVFSAATGTAMAERSVLFGIMTDYFIRLQTHTISSNEFSEESNYLFLVYIYFAIFTFVATYISLTTWVYTGERIARQIREQYFRAVLRQNIAYFDKYGTGEVATRITSDIHLVQDGISEKFSLAFLYISHFIATLIISLTISWKMTLVIGCIIPFLAINSSLMNKYSAIFTKRNLDFYSRAGIIAEESISTIRAAVAFGAQKKLSDLYDAYLGEAKKEGFKKSLLVGFTLGIMFFGMYASASLSFFYGAINNEISFGQVVSVSNLIVNGFFSLTTFYDYIQAISLATGAGSKLFETIDRVPSIDIASDTGDKPKIVTGHIQLKNIKFIYPTRPDAKILNNISLDLEPGSIVALVGSSGSGKSTIASLILRFYDPHSGDIFLDGHNIKSLNLIWLRRQIGFVNQEPVLFKTTIAENVSYGLIGSIYENLPNNEKREMIENACKKANAHDFIMKFPDKYETMVGERGTLLSGGQKQRIAIARAIIKDPRILLLDEATSALDTQSENIIQNALDQASKGRTTIVIAHRLSTIRNATKIIVMNKGVIVESGTHKELMDKKGYYSKLVETQKIIQTLKAEKNILKESFNILNSNIPSLKDEVTTSLTANDINYHQINLVTRASSHASSHSNLDQQNSDVEIGLTHDDHNYTVLEMIKKILFIDRSEFLILSIGIISSIINGCLSPIFGISYANVFHAFTKTGDALHNEATFWSLMILVFSVMIFFVNAIQNVALGFSSEKLTEKIRSISFASILRQDISFFDEENHSVGILTSHLSLDVTYINGLAGITLGNLLHVTFMIFASVIVSFIIGWKFTLVCICSIPIMIAAGGLRIKILSNLQQKTKKAYEYSTQIACEAAYNIRTVAVLTCENNLWERYHNLLDEPMRQSTKNALLASIPFAFANCIFFLITALAFWYGSILIMNNEYDLKRVITIFAVLVMGSSFTGRFFAYAPDMVKAKSASDYIMKLLERVPNIDTWSQNGEKIKFAKGHLKFSNVHFRYPTRPNFPVLQGLNLEIKPGQNVALVGPSGCGKSTIISLVEMFYQVTNGTITLDEIDIAKMNVNNLREHIALVSQEPSLYDMTIKENILLGCLPGQNITQNDLEKVCRQANIHEFIVGLANGYDTRVGGKGIQLSGGQKQRVAIARALIRNPKILLLDEATSALDSESEKVVQNALDAAAHGRTTIAIAHRLSTIQNADIIFVIKDGKVHEQGTHQELLELQGIYFMMIQKQHLGESN
ncbi:P-loop containing nucleoside triphosphate hydrolase protein [Gigaspora margarita]|uniref:P-loop containing nucleoside triphosphate hydrolase protein n=1 Tax=Gigaspora margarita TaxID=4874 RepID=A0A8H4A8T3_GIGMA|nr:P-loop containing nucleoside triphosphate hydrolase protein [Gigaspora margarita]